MNTRLPTTIAGLVAITAVAIAGMAYADEKMPIPDWIKQTAGFWVDGLIDDEAYINSIQYLVEQDIIAIPIPETAITQAELDELREAHEAEITELTEAHQAKNTQLQTQITNLETQILILKNSEPTDTKQTISKPGIQSNEIRMSNVQCSQPNDDNNIIVRADITNLSTHPNLAKYIIYINDENGEELSYETYAMSIRSESTEQAAEVIEYNKHMEYCGIKLIEVVRLSSEPQSKPHQYSLGKKIHSCGLEHGWIEFRAHIENKDIKSIGLDYTIELQRSNKTIKSATDYIIIPPSQKTFIEEYFRNYTFDTCDMQIDNIRYTE